MILQACFDTCQEINFSLIFMHNIRREGGGIKLILYTEIHVYIHQTYPRCQSLGFQYLFPYSRCRKSYSGIGGSLKDIFCAKTKQFNFTLLRILSKLIELFLGIIRRKIKELILCHKLKYYKPYIFATWWCKPLIFQT